MQIYLVLGQNLVTSREQVLITIQILNSIEGKSHSVPQVRDRYTLMTTFDTVYMREIPAVT